jgi:hypothetical protein
LNLLLRPICGFAQQPLSMTQVYAIPVDPSPQELERVF